MLNNALLLLASKLAHDIRLSIGIHLFEDAALVGAVY